MLSMKLINSPVYCSTRIQIVGVLLAMESALIRSQKLLETQKGLVWSLSRLLLGSRVAYDALLNAASSTHNFH